MYFKIAAGFMYSAFLFVQFFRKRWKNQKLQWKTIKPPTSKLCEHQAVTPTYFMNEILPEDSNYMEKFTIK